MIKTRAQSDLPVWKKIQKTTRKYSFSEKSHFGWFLGFFSKLVSPIELQFLSLAQCPSRTSFDRSHHRSATILNFDPYIVIFQIFRPLEGNPKLPTGCDFLAKTSPNWSYQNILGDTQVFEKYTPPYRSSCIQLHPYIFLISLISPLETPLLRPIRYCFRRSFVIIVGQFLFLAQAFQ